MSLCQGYQYRTGGRTGLTTGTIYFGYRCTVSGLSLFFIFINEYIYIYYNKYKSLP